MNKEKLMDLVNTNFNKFQLEIKRFYKEEYVVSLEQQCKKQKEIIDKAINIIVKETKSMPTNGCKIRLIEILDILNKVSE